MLQSIVRPKFWFGSVDINESKRDVRLRYLIFIEFKKECKVFTIKMKSAKIQGVTKFWIEIERNQKVKKGKKVVKVCLHFS